MNSLSAKLADAAEEENAIAARKSDLIESQIAEIQLEADQANELIDLGRKRHRTKFCIHRNGADPVKVLTDLFRCRFITLNVRLVIR